MARIETTSSTPESAIAAALESTKTALQVLQDAIAKGGAFGRTIP